MKVQHDARIGGGEAHPLQATSLDGLGDRNELTPLGIFELDGNTSGQDTLRREVFLVKQRSAFEDKDHASPGGVLGSDTVHVDAHQTGFGTVGPGRLEKLRKRLWEPPTGLRGRVSLAAHGDQQQPEQTEF
ncbi:MAG: hypothetical protein JSU89_14295 [Myxococcales bacterium]|nr:MAG: hypothetical protein JSU89_14295 [Myxococcales bacterium]